MQCFVAFSQKTAAGNHADGSCVTELKVLLELLRVVAEEVCLLTFVLVEEVIGCPPLPLHNQGKDLLSEHSHWRKHKKKKQTDSFYNISTKCV